MKIIERMRNKRIYKKIEKLKSELRFLDMKIAEHKLPSLQLCLEKDLILEEIENWKNKIR